MDWKVLLKWLKSRRLDNLIHLFFLKIHLKSPFLILYVFLFLIEVWSRIKPQSAKNILYLLIYCILPLDYNFTWWIVMIWSKMELAYSQDAYYLLFFKSTYEYVRLYLLNYYRKIQISEKRITLRKLLLTLVTNRAQVI